MPSCVCWVVHFQLEVIWMTKSLLTVRLARMCRDFFSRLMLGSLEIYTDVGVFLFGGRKTSHKFRIAVNFWETSKCCFVHCMLWEFI